ncbi:MAG: hypothetical protein JST48_08830 [Bacteroidetes bacterium]|nr:hypothetical protein [Bacteroidota bacterium]
MFFKISKVIWFFSLLIVLGVFMYVYAALPENVVVNENQQAVNISKEVFFYICLAVIALANAFVFAVSRIYPQTEEYFKGWFYGLTVCANIFFVTGLCFISLYNSSEKFDYPRIGFIIYGSIILLAGWSVSWPIFRLSQKIFDKQLSE